MRHASLWVEPLVQLVFWSALTVGCYVAAKHLHARRRRWWTMPVIPTSVAVGAVLWMLHVPYQAYSEATGWLPALLGPATVAFAVPIYQHRAMIRRQWRVLLVSMLAGSFTAIATSWGLASMLGVDGEMRLSLLPRSISTPFAVSVSTGIGGIPGLPAVFVVATGLVGALLGDLLLLHVPLRLAWSRGTLLGMGAHGAGTAKAYEVGQEEGAIAGLTMVLVELLNVALAPLVGVVLF
jgi:predicted murein hydrolase (TIGR00659 family)